MPKAHFDVLIVGAGLSGIGAACRLQAKCPSKSFALLEGRDRIGGTWDLFRYPGIRSDSDMYTLGYDFKPWTGTKAIADGGSILKYLDEAAAEHGIVPHIRFGHRVRSASWSSEQARWTVETARTDGSLVVLTCNFLFVCGGYYNYAQGHVPAFEGIGDYRGTLLHPQEWPEDLAYAGRHVAVIGSGATAMTLVPALAQGGARVTMVQRSPTYVISRPAEDAIARLLRRLLPEKWAYALTRRKNVTLQRFFYRRARRAPEQIKSMLLRGVRNALGPDYDIEKHFTPRYNPWDQRLCLIPDGDLFEAIRSGRVDVVTDEIDRFTARGIRLKSGRDIEADIVVTATGLELVVMSGIAFTVDGAPIDFARTFAYKGMMFTGVPNLAQTFGYINASWTLRADLVAEYVCRLIRHMDRVGTRQCTPMLRDEDQGMPARPWVDTFTPGYMQRALHRFPKQGDRDPWRNPQDYARDRKLLRRDPIDDGVLRFSNPDDRAAQAENGTARGDEDARVSAVPRS